MKLKASQISFKHKNNGLGLIPKPKLIDIEYVSWYYSTLVILKAISRTDLLELAVRTFGNSVKR